MEVHFANPLKARCIAESTQKYDKGDALTLARMLRSGFFPEAFKVTDDIYELRTVLRTRAFFVRQSTAAKNYLHGTATTRGLHNYPDDSPLKKAGKEYVREQGDISARTLLHHIETQAVTVKTFEPALRAHLVNYKDARILMTIPGVGMLTALTVVAEVGDMRRFPSPEKLASFSGLVPSQRSSGDHVRFGHITNRGSRMLRTALTEAAMRITSTNAPKLYAYYYRLAQSKSPKQARVALARKLAGIMWSMIQSGTPYKEAL
jgi:transposase